MSGVATSSAPAVMNLPPTIYLSLFYMRFDKGDAMTIVQEPPLRNAQFIPRHLGGSLSVCAHHGHSILPSIFFIVPAHLVSLFDDNRMGIAPQWRQLARTL